MVKLLKKILIVVGLLCLGGCSLLENKNTREYMEKHFSYLKKYIQLKMWMNYFKNFHVVYKLVTA